MKRQIEKSQPLGKLKGLFEKVETFKKGCDPSKNWVLEYGFSMRKTPHHHMEKVWVLAWS